MASSSASPVETIPVIKSGPRAHSTIRPAVTSDSFPDGECLRMLRGQRRADDRFVRAIAEPPALNFPRRMRDAFSPVLKLVPSGTGTSCSYHVPTPVVVRILVPTDRLRGTSRNGVNPRILCRQKIVLSLPEIRFGQIRALVHGAVIDAADFERQRVRLRRDEQIRAQAAKFPREAVAHFERNGKRRRRHGHADDQRCGRQHLAARIADEGFAYEAGKHV